GRITDINEFKRSRLANNSNCGITNAWYGTIMDSRIIENIRFFPLNWNFANAYPAEALTRPPKKVYVTVIIDEFSSDGHIFISPKRLFRLSSKCVPGIKLEGILRTSPEGFVAPTIIQ